MMNKDASWQQVRELIFMKVQMVRGARAAASGDSMDVDQFSSDDEAGSGQGPRAGQH